MTLVDLSNKADVEQALSERRANAPEKIDNASLPAGSPMFYYCQMCGHQTAVMPEAWFINPPPRFCDFCQRIRDAGWLEL